MKRPLANFFVLFFLILVMLFSKVLASETAIRVELFDIGSGLSQSSVTCLHIDSYGFIWIGTQDGLNRYDGYSFKTYRNNPIDTTTLSNNNINSICEDSSGNLWVGTWNGLSMLSRATGQFKNYYHNPINPYSLSSNRVFNVYRDSYGTIWVKTLDALDKYDPQTDSFIRFPHYSDPFSFLSDNYDFTIYEDSKKRLWVGTKDGLMYFDRQLGLFKRYSHNPNNSKSISDNRVKHIYEDTHNNLWIATANGLNRFLPDSETFIRYLGKPNSPNSLRSGLVNVVFQDSQGELLIGTNEGLARFDYEKQQFFYFTKSAKGIELYETAISSIIEDRSNILWIGSQSGLIKWDRKSQKFLLYDKDFRGNNLFSGNIVASIYEDDQSVLWVGTWGTGLHLFDRKTGRVTKYTEKSPPPLNISNDYVHVIYPMRNGNILIGTRSGVQIFNKGSRRFEDYFSRFGIETKQHFAQNRIYDIKEDNLGNLWVATRLGLYKFDGKSIEGFFHNPTDSLSLSSSEIHCIELDNNYLWVGTFNGLNRLDIQTKEIIRFIRASTYQKGDLISNDIVSLLIDSRGDLWVGTSSGLHRYNKPSNFFYLYTESDGLPNNLIYAIVEDNIGNIWVSTNWGLAMINHNTYDIISYGVSDGLQSYEFNVGASHKSSKGTIYFGGILGLNAFDPESITINTVVPKMTITSLELIGSFGSIELPISDNVVVINRNFSLLNIEFAALDFTRPGKNQYKYMMEGLEGDWIDIGTRRMATFSNLKEGVYNFRVIGSNSDNVWNEEGVTLRIVIKTAFWKSRLAYWIYTFFGIVSLIVFLRTRTRMLRKTRRLLRERESTMAEMELQREELMSKNKNITDSIHYAKRIQEALIPSEQHFKKILPDSFILYLPKDIVSGDFYWVNETHNKIFVAAIDCTGHGVPGAFMSIIGVELLRNITNVMGVNDAAEILNRLDKGVFDTFSKNTEDISVNVKDGMDVSFCVIDKELNTLQFAGAFTNLYLIRDSKIIEIKGDRVSVGVGYDPDKPLFQNHEFVIEPDDMIYMFTDGYVDQFGGPEGKKYKFRRFRHLLLSIHKYPLEVQRKYLQGSINEWKGNLEQVDDILIIGIKPDLSCFF